MFVAKWADRAEQRVVIVGTVVVLVGSKGVKEIPWEEGNFMEECGQCRYLGQMGWLV